MPTDLNYDFRFNFCSPLIYTTNTSSSDWKKGPFFLLFRKKKGLETKGFRRCKNLSACVTSTPPPQNLPRDAPPPPSYLQTHYTRFVLKTVQFIGAGLLILFLRRLFYYLKEPRCGPQDKSDLWLAQGTLWSLRSLITATPGAALSSGAPAITHANPLLCTHPPARPTPVRRRRVFICIVCVSRWVLQKCGRQRRRRRWWRFMAFSLNHWPV